MTSTPRILLASLALILLVCLLSAEARRHSADDSSELSRQHRHRHRHQLPSKQQPRRPAPKYEEPSDDYSDLDYEDEYSDEELDQLEDDDDNDEDYSSERRARPSHNPKRIGNHHRYEPRYGPRYHHRGTGRAPPPAAPRAHHRNRYRKRFEEEDRPRRRFDEEYESEEDDEEDGYHYARQKHTGPRKRISKPRYEPRRYDEDDDYGYEADDEDEDEESETRPKHAGRRYQEAWRSSKLDEWLKRTRTNSSLLPGSKKRRAESQSDEPRSEDEEDIWKEDEELDNDFYKNDQSTSLKSYDELIRRLTDDGSTKRDYRNADLERHLRRDAYGNLRFFEPKRSRTKSLDLDSQSDANTDYADDETDDAESSPASSSSTSTTTTTSTTSTTTTERPSLNSRSGSSPRSYEPASTGSQYNGYQAKSDYPAMSAHSALKWQYLGTRESVKETRNSMSQFKSAKSAEQTAAHIHAMRVAKEGGCKVPRAKVISVRELYPNSTSTYIPHCAILHRCSDDTGCCRSETLTCEAKLTERVGLYFYATDIHGESQIEKLWFSNHSECECRDRKSIKSADKPQEHRSVRHYPNSPVPLILKPTPARKVCRCPTQFTANMTFDGFCECKCVEHDDDCVKILHGKGYLSWKDRVCIQSEQCQPPSCTYGSYIVSQGRCPKKKDVFNATATHRSQFNYHPRRS